MIAPTSFAAGPIKQNPTGTQTNNTTAGTTNVFTTSGTTLFNHFPLVLQ